MKTADLARLIEIHDRIADPLNECTALIRALWEKIVELEEQMSSDNTNRDDILARADVRVKIASRNDDGSLKYDDAMLVRDLAAALRAERDTVDAKLALLVDAEDALAARDRELAEAREALAEAREEVANADAIHARHARELAALREKQEAPGPVADTDWKTRAERAERALAEMTKYGMKVYEEKTYVEDSLAKARGLLHEAVTFYLHGNAGPFSDRARAFLAARPAPRPLQDVCTTCGHTELVHYQAEGRGIPRCQAMGCECLSFSRADPRPAPAACTCPADGTARGGDIPHRLECPVKTPEEHLIIACGQTLCDCEEGQGRRHYHYQAPRADPRPAPLMSCGCPNTCHLAGCYLKRPDVRERAEPPAPRAGCKHGYNDFGNGPCPLCPAAAKRGGDKP